METTIELANPGVTVVPPSEDTGPTSADSSAPWNEFDTFLAKNGQLVDQCSQADLIAALKGDKKAAIEGIIGTYTETIKIVLDGLVTLGKIHPVISGAVETFVMLISLDLERRENDKKVLVIRVAMRNMMCTFLRHIKETNEVAMKTKSTLERLIGNMIRDMIKCSSDLNGYLDHRLLTRIVASHNYEKQFQKHLECFAKHQSDLHLAISVHTALGVDRANTQLDRISTKEDITHTKIDAIDSKLDIFQQLFCTPNEWEALKFIAKHGVKECVNQKELLQKLVSLVGDDQIDNEKGLKAGQLERKMAVARDEYEKNFATTLKENEERFKQILEIQKINHNLLRIYNPNIKLADPELQRIWKLMGYKTIAKAKHFVLTFRDHYQHAQSLPVTPTSPQANRDQTLQTPVDTLSVKTGDQNDIISGSADDPNAWLLEYLDVAHVRPIVEAMDMDGSGFVSVEELNRFAGSRPKQWSLLQWMVYWAAGWHLNIVDYREKIYDILVQMHEAVPAIHTANSVWVASYLDCYPIQCIEGLLRSTLDVQDKRNSQLSELAEFYANIQQSSIKSKLEAASYKLASEADACLVGGTGRPESWLYPLLYLILERHLAIINLAKFYVLDDKEMSTHHSTLFWLMSVLDQRKDALQAIFSQTYQAVDVRFETFACGMFQASYKSDTDIVPLKNDLFKTRTKRTTQDLVLDMARERLRPKAQDDVSILVHPPKGSFNFELSDVNQISAIEPTNHSISGYWSAVYISEAGSVYLTFHCVLSVDTDGNISGDYEGWVGISKMAGNLDTHSDPAMLVRLEYSVGEAHFQLRGKYDPDREAIEGEFEETPIPQLTPTNESDVIDTASKNKLLNDNNFDGQDDQNHEPALNVHGQQTLVTGLDGDHTAEHLVGDTGTQGVTGSNHEDDFGKHGTDDVADMLEDSDLDTSRLQRSEDITHTDNVEELKFTGAFYMTRTPAELIRFRSYLNSENPPFPRPIPSLPMRRWFFAIEATRYQVRARAMSWGFISERLMERRDYLGWLTRFCYGVLEDTDDERQAQLVVDCSPSQIRLYESISSFLLNKQYAFRTTLGYIFCNNCYQDIVGERYRCITCTTNDLTNQIDLCGNPLCIDSSTSYPFANLIHESSHTLLRHNNYVFACELPILLPHCRTLSENVKKRFRALDEQKQMSDKIVRRTGKSRKGEQRRTQGKEVVIQPLICVCCREPKEVTLPCWICATCDSETAICLDCERTHAAVRRGDGNRSRVHSHNHILLRISDSKEVDSGEVNNVKLQQQLNKIAFDLHHLEGKVIGHLTTASQWIKASARTETSNPGTPVHNDVQNIRVVPTFNTTGETGAMPDSDGDSDSDDPDDPYGYIVDAQSLKPTIESQPNSINQENLVPTSSSETIGLNASSMSTGQPVMTTSSVQPTLGDSGLPPLQTHIESLDIRMSNVEASLATMDVRFNQVLSLLNQLAAR
ncbi:hypothetical protein D9619_009984 [Psilocybe cf. subviscida]|uniref:EF-hand domain-containing protein n=1 Tax=Psilocybe cf. subviscida TaxID=2480587 RepID=A0A8H5F673_9AGAR|nr:hypothetical protein D9619_009984 [Psilocybe cf. subviscida]